MGAWANNLLVRKEQSKDGEDEEAYMRWYLANTIMGISRVRLHNEPQRDPPHSLMLVLLLSYRVGSLFLDHVVQSCDRSIAANVDLVNFISLIKKKVDRFRSTFGTTYEDYVETCSTSASEDDDMMVTNMTTRPVRRSQRISN
eukprot:TRINITY_DN10547_c1_g1_i3.p1 TRINITY_DN10547_c1_g1~~TRINITY_DN10547_c1_g1_i3.p1  ORF type:complete len:143 (+),score=4.87 TRINITY_DN10547_c1_g1_i3:242-670(+)